MNKLFFLIHPSICDLVVPQKKFHKSIHVTAIDKSTMNGRTNIHISASNRQPCYLIYLFIYLLVLLSWLISVLTYLHGFLCFVLLLLLEFFLSMRPGQTRPGPGHFPRIDWTTTTAPLSACLPAYKKKRSGFDFWQSSKPQKLLVNNNNNNNNQKLYSVGRRFSGACKRYRPACLLVLPCSPRLHQGYGEFGGLKMFFFNSGENLFFMCVCV